MSKYYKINDLKVRVSDHEPNFSMDKFRGANEVELYVVSADNQLLSVQSQIEQICDKRGYDIDDFQEVINDWQDGTYDKNVFKSSKEEEETASFNPEFQAWRQTRNDELCDKLKGHTLKKGAKHAEIKALSELTGVSQSFIKKYFNR